MPLQVECTLMDDDKRQRDEVMGRATFVIETNGGGQVDRIPLDTQGAITVRWELGEEKPREGFTTNTAESHTLAAIFEHNAL